MADFRYTQPQSIMVTVPQNSTVPGNPANRAVAIAFALTAVLSFSLYNAVSKWLVTDYSPWQIMFFRGLFGFTPLVVYLVATRNGGVLRSDQPVLQVLRALLGLSANALFIFAYRNMPLADAVAIGYAAPVFIVLLSAPLLSEHVGLRRASAAVVGFLGVVMIAQPGAGLLSSGAPYALAGTLCHALLLISTRRLGLSDNAFCTVLYSNGIYVGISAVLMSPDWSTPGLIDFVLLAATGLFGGAGMLLSAHAYRHAEAALLAPFDYTAILWTATFGYLIWGDIPAPIVMAGMAVVAGSGIFLVRHEHRRQPPETPP